MKVRDYNKDTHECRNCGCLVPNTRKGLASHSDEDCLLNRFHQDEREKEFQNNLRRLRLKEGR